MASASADGAPYLVPLSFDWDGEALLMGPRRRTARPAGTWPPPGPFGWGWATPATAAGWSDASAGRAAWPGPEAPRAEAAWMPWLFALSATPASVSRTGFAPARPTPPIR
ncbi:MAG: hypothetical protein ACRDQ9_04200 [Pseudonocardiaceae bacterium]